ncbi:hypothetical protein Tco_0838682 [Tanacetum coccineum]|uniref:CCHC-type domain-containing protein n=1 Tax=Tanacetum coccineum TaxID=301880 RepID=A0ABQ5ANH5_9ASTR
MVEVDTVRCFVAGLGKLKIAIRNQSGAKHVEVKLVLEREVVFSIIIRRRYLYPYLLGFILTIGKVFEIWVDEDNQLLEFLVFLGFREAYKDMCQNIEFLNSASIFDIHRPLSLIDLWRFIQRNYKVIPRPFRSCLLGPTSGYQSHDRVLPPATQEEQFADEKERKARTLLLMAVPKDHLRRFHASDKPKISAAINTNTMNDANHKFLRLPVLPDAFEQTSKRHHLLPLTSDNVAFSNTSQSLSSKHISQPTAQEVIVLLPFPLPKHQQLLLPFLADEIAMTAIKIKKFYKKTGRRPRVDGKMHVAFDKRKVECFNCHNTGHCPGKCQLKVQRRLSRQEGMGRGQDFKPVRTEKEALMTIDEDSYNALQAKYDELQSEFGDRGKPALTAHKLAVKKLESQLRASHKQQSSLTEKLNFQANQIFEKDEKLKKYRRIGMKAVKDKDALQKNCLGYGIQSNAEVLGYEEEISRGIFALREIDAGYYDIPLYNRFKQLPLPPKRTQPQCLNPNNRQNGNQNNKGKLGADILSFERKTCFVCGSLSHLIKDCDYYEKKMAREAALKSQRVVHADVRQATPAWTNTNRVNKANQFTPRPVQLNNIRPNLSTASKTIKTGRVNVNTGHGNVSTVSSAGTQIKSGSSRFNTGKQNVNSGSVHVNTARVNRPVSNQTSNKTSPKLSQVNLKSPKKCFSKHSSPVNRPFSRNTAHKSNKYAVKGKMGTAVKTSAGCVWRKVIPLSNTNSGPTPDSNVNVSRGPILKIIKNYPKWDLLLLEEVKVVSVEKICDKKLNVLFTEKEKVKKLENKLRQKRKREETEDAEGQDQDIPSQTDQGNKFATPEKSKDSGEAQAEQISPSTLEAAQILTNVASEGFKGSQAPPGSKIYRRKPKSTATPTKVLDFEEPAERPVTTTSTAVNTGSTPSAQVNTGSTPSAELNTGETERVQRREGKAPMTEEDLQAEVQASKKSREQELQVLADLEAAQRLQATMDAEAQRQIHLDELLARRLVEQEEEAAKEALATEFDYIQARLNADQILAEKIQQEEREQYSIEDRAKFLHDTIAAQRKFLTEQRMPHIKNKPPNQYHNIKTFVAIRSEEDERAVKKMNEQAADKEKEQKAESVHEEVQEEEGAKKRKLGTRRKLKAKRRKYTSGLTREDDDLKIEDLKAVYELVMGKYQDEIPEGFDKMLWGDLIIMFNQGDTADFWDEQLNWKIISWKLHSSSGLEEFEDSDDDDLAKSDHEEAERVGVLTNHHTTNGLLLVEVDIVRCFVAGLGKLKIAIRNQSGAKHVEVKLVLEREVVFSIIIRRRDLYPYLLGFILRNGKVFEIWVDGDNQLLEFLEFLGFREAYKDMCRNIEDVRKDRPWGFGVGCSRIRWLEPKLRMLMEGDYRSLDAALIQGWSFMSKVTRARKMSTVAPPGAKLGYDAYDLDMVGKVLPPATQEEQFADEKERKARTLLLMAVPKDHLRRFHASDKPKISAAINTNTMNDANHKFLRLPVLRAWVIVYRP